MTMVMRGMEFTFESTRRNETICLGLAATLHVLMMLWNPIILRSDWHPPHDFVTVDVVDQSAAPMAETPTKMTLMDTLKDMVSSSRQSIAHMAPIAIAQHLVPIANAPLLKEAVHSRLFTTPTVTPRTMQKDELAAGGAQNQIQMQNHAAVLPGAVQPALKARAYSGVRASDLPFQVSQNAPEALSAGGAAPIAIAVGNNSARSALAYTAPALKEAPGRHTSSLSDLGARSQASEAASLAGNPSAGAQQIALSGTNTSRMAPTAGAVPALQDRSGNSGGGRVSAALLGGRTGGSAYSSALNTLPSQSAASPATLPNASQRNDQATVKKAFDISGPLRDRRIITKVVPSYPSWAEEQNIVGSVQLYFTVTPEGGVRPDITLRKTTGYPQLDQLAIDALKQWKFAPAPEGSDGGQWGIITFNFSLTS